MPLSINTDTNLASLPMASGGDSISIAAGRLTIDSFFFANEVNGRRNFIGNITINPEGEILIDGTKVREISFSGGSGTFPPFFSTVSFSGGAIAQIIHLTGTSTTGKLTVRNLSGNVDPGETISSSDWAAISSARSKVGMLVVLFGRGVTITVPRLGKFKTDGDYYILGNGNGSPNQTISFPYRNIPVIEVEISAGSGIYEQWVSIGSSTFVSSASTGNLGRVFRQSGSPNIVFGDGVNGKIPGSGSIIRCPNILIGFTDTANVSNSQPANILDNTTATNYPTFDTLKQGLIEIKKTGFSGISLVFAKAYSVTILQSGLIGGLVKITENILKISLIEFSYSASGLFIGSPVWDISGDIDVINCLTLPRTTNGMAIRMSNIKNGSIARSVFAFFGNKLSYAYVLLEIKNSRNFEFLDCLTAGGTVKLDGCSFIHFKNHFYSDYANNISLSGTSISVLSLYDSSNIFFEGLTLSNLPPQQAILYAEESFSIALKDIGSRSTPINTPYVIFETTGTNRGFVSEIGCFKVFVLGAISNNPQLNTLTLRDSGSGYSAIANKGKDNQLLGVQASEASLSTLNLAGTSGFGVFLLWFSATSGGIGTFCTEATDNPISANAYIKTPGAAFDGNGKLLLRAVGDSITWESEDLSGVSGFTSQPILVGTGTTNLAVSYDIDLGAGFSGLFVPATLLNLSGIEIAIADKFRLRWKVDCVVADPSNSLSLIYFPISTTAIAQDQVNFPDTQEASLGLTGLVEGSEIRIYDSVTGVELAGIESSATSFIYTYNWSNDFDVDLVIFHVLYEAIRIDGLRLTDQRISIPVQQRIDRFYGNF